MKLKLDENLGQRGRDLLIASGHDVCTVAEQNLCSATDEAVARRCTEDGRAIITLDLDFSGSSGNLVHKPGVDGNKSG